MRFSYVLFDHFRGLVASVLRSDCRVLFVRFVLTSKCRAQWSDFMSLPSMFYYNNILIVRLFGFGNLIFGLFFLV